MHRKNIPEKTGFNIPEKFNTALVGESIEAKMRRIVNNKEPIKDATPTIYQERKDGVQPQYDIRADKWEAAVGAQDYVGKFHKDKRAKGMAAKAKEGMDKEAQNEQKIDGKPGSTPATE